MKRQNNILPSPPNTINLPNDILADIYDNHYQDVANDYEADYWIEQEKAGLLDIVEP